MKPRHCWHASGIGLNIDHTCCFCGVVRMERKEQVPADDGHGSYATRGRVTKTIIRLYGADKDGPCRVKDRP